jgi:hypothetical protein
VKFANFVGICITRGKNNHFRLKNGYFFPARNANIYKICELHSAIFSSFYSNSQPNFAILLILRCSFQLWELISFFLSRSKYRPKLESSILQLMYGISTLCRLVAKFNNTNTIGDVRNFVNAYPFKHCIVFCLKFCIFCW